MQREWFVKTSFNPVKLDDAKNNFMCIGTYNKQVQCENTKQTGYAKETK